MWWLQSGWTSATCSSCGCNIWKAGGDPDMGVCPDCFYSERYAPEPEPVPMCDICKVSEACACSGEFYVCSYECECEAQRRTALKKEEANAANHVG